MSRTVRGAGVAALAAGYLALAAAVLVPAPWLAVALVAALVVSEVLLTRIRADLMPDAVRLRLPVRFRLLSVDVLVTVLAARVGAGPLVVALIACTVLVLHGARDASGIFRRRAGWRRNGGPVSWRGLAVPGLPRPVTPRVVPPLSAPLAALTVLLPFGLALVGPRSSDAPAVVAALIVAGTAIAVTAGRALQYFLQNRVPREAVRAALRDAVTGYAPQVLVHFSGRRGTTDQLVQWLPALAGLPHRVLIMVREPHHLAALEDAGLPVVFAPLSTDVELLTVPSIDVALYVTDVTNINNHLLRVPGVYDVLIGHGDSDEAENASPIARMYDEVWVLGSLGRRRYADPRVGLADSRIREIGPLPLALRAAVETVPPSAAGLRTVVYAPNWESVLDSTDRSSLLTQGAALVEAALAAPGVRLLLAPAGGTGSRVREYADALDRLQRRIAHAGAPHAVVDALALPRLLSSAALVVTDVSPVLTDAVLADVPHAVPLPLGADEAAYRDATPTAGAAALLPDAGALVAALDDATGPDARRPARAALRPVLFGPDTRDFAAGFAAAIDDAVASQHARRAFIRPTVASSS